MPCSPSYRLRAEPVASPLLRVASNARVGDSSMPFLGAANIWVEDSLVDGRSIALVQTLVHEGLTRTAPGQLEVTIFDESLSGLGAPFWPLASGAERILHLIHDERDFAATLKHLKNHVQAVKGVMQGKQRSLTEFHASVNTVVESYRLVVVSADFSNLPELMQVDLAVLMKAGPSAGVTFLIHSMTLGANPYVVALCEKLTVKVDAIQREDAEPIRAWTPVSADRLIEASNDVVVGMSMAAAEPPSFYDIQSVDRTWLEDSRDGITFAVGKYGVDTVQVTLGDELHQRHNALLTGAVGQGKSNLLSVMIHSLCQRYAPRELELYLLDFKEGVSLQRFAGSEGTGHLPHAQVLGLEADREFALGVLQHLFKVYRQRMRTFKAVGVQSLREYREALPEQPMPRILVVIDEFQLMFGEQDKISAEIAKLLTSAVRLFRACGIHIVLASQSIGGNVALMATAGEALFAQIPIRIALKNSLSESYATLSLTNDAASHLRAREAIVNLDYGAPAANRKTSIAFADEHVLEPLRGQWSASAPGTSVPFVFDGERRRSLRDDGTTLADLVARGGRNPSVMLGARIEVGAPPLTVPLGRDPGRNIGVIGGVEAITLLQSAVLSLAQQLTSLRIIVLDGMSGDPTWSGTREAFEVLIEEAGHPVEIVAPANVGVVVDELGATRVHVPSAETVVVLGLGLDRVRSMPPAFEDLVRIGPAAGVHVFGWWSKLSSFRDHVGYGGEAWVDVRIATRCDPQSAKQLMDDPLLDWDTPDNRALAWDSASMPRAVRVVPYSIVETSGTSAHGSHG